MNTHSDHCACTWERGGTAEQAARTLKPCALHSVWADQRLRECEEALRSADTELAKQEAVLVAADRLKDAYDAMLEGRDIGRLPEWEAKPNPYDFPPGVKGSGRDDYVP